MAGHCVVRLEDFVVLYQGTDAAAAKVAAVEGSHWAEAPTVCAAIVRAANDAVSISRGRILPRMRSPACYLGRNSRAANATPPLLRKPVAVSGAGADEDAAGG